MAGYQLLVPPPKQSTNFKVKILVGRSHSTHNYERIINRASYLYNIPLKMNEARRGQRAIRKDRLLAPVGPVAGWCGLAAGRRELAAVGGRGGGAGLLPGVLALRQLGALGGGGLHGQVDRGLRGRGGVVDAGLVDAEGAEGLGREELALAQLLEDDGLELVRHGQLDRLPLLGDGLDHLAADGARDLDDAVGREHGALEDETRVDQALLLGLGIAGGSEQAIDCGDGALVGRDAEGLEDVAEHRVQRRLDRLSLLEAHGRARQGESEAVTADADRGLRLGAGLEARDVGRGDLLRHGLLGLLGLARLRHLGLAARLDESGERESDEAVQDSLGIDASAVVGVLHGYDILRYDVELSPRDRPTFARQSLLWT